MASGQVSMVMWDWALKVHIALEIKLTSKIVIRRGLNGEAQDCPAAEVALAMET